MATADIYVKRTVNLFDKFCTACGSAFRGPSNRIYCSNICRQRTTMRRYYQRRRARFDTPTKPSPPLKEWT